MAPSHFDILFGRNVPHILERMFFSLDYESFQTCFGVSDNWRMLLKSETIQRKAKLSFQDEIWEDQFGLHTASFKGDFVSFLRVKGFTSFGLLDINYREPKCPYTGLDDATPMSAALLGGNIEVAQLLREKGAVLDQTCEELWNTLEDKWLQEHPQQQPDNR